MLKMIPVVIISLLFISITFSASVDDQYLVAINLSQTTDLSELEDLELSVYHILKEILIAVVSDDDINHLNSAGFSWQLLDEYPDNNNYYIVTAKKADLVRPVIKNQIIFDLGDVLIIKNIPPEREDLTSKKLVCVEMKKHPGVYKSEKVSLHQNISTSLDSVISDVLMEINVDSVRSYIQGLQDFGTRFLLADTKDSVASWIQNQFKNMGYTEVAIDEFMYGGTLTQQKNVIATITGSRDPDRVFVIGGHHDSITGSDPMNFAPGADDNASGTAAVLEIARVIIESGYQPEATFKFVTFAAEEYGLHGSRDFAEKAYNDGMNIKLMINHDMISHTRNAVENSTADINYYTGSEEFHELAKSNIENYTIIDAHDGTKNSAGSDSYSFWSYDFPAVYFEERDFSPYYHSNQDIIDNYSMEFCTEVIKASCATLISASMMPSRVEKYKIVDRGDGTSLLLTWAPNTESDLTGYHIYLGKQSGIYDTVYATTDTSLIVNNLIDELTYYIGISAYDVDMIEGAILEKLAVPRMVPLKPSSVYDEPLWHAVELHWAPNLEVDISGYNIYRSISPTEPFVQVNESLISDTSYTDNTSENVIFYYYVITAVDHSQNESINSDTVKSRNVSLDQGILLVDETSNGSGQILSPTDTAVDSFYSSILKRFNPSSFDVMEESGISLAELGAYSTIIWHGNDYFSEVSLPVKRRIILEKYLEYGGNLLYTGILPSMAFEGNVIYPKDFSTGDFIYDFFKISCADYIFGSRFRGAIPLSYDYTNIYTDTSKTPENTNYHLPRIEGIEPAPGGMALFEYDTNFDTTTVAGSMNGQTVGVAYLGEDYKVVVLSFPLYYMQIDQARELMINVLRDHFDEVMTIDEEKDLIPLEFSLNQNYPNPFNPKTIINYELPMANDLDLSIYNVLGQKVVTLVSGRQKAGKYQIEWDASRFASGLYYYVLKSGEFRDVKKMVLLK